jgi:photosynthetic reaction center cytochrome c subunit
MQKLPLIVGAGVVAAAAFLIIVPEWTAPPISATQVGPSPTSMIQFNQGHMREPVSQEAPPPLPPAATGGPSATATYKNVQVLKDVSAAEFMRLQYAITQWVSPQQGCGFCHEGENYASDAKPTKAAARLMLEAVRHINADWGNHVNPAGVTCYTCHRGQPVPAETWFPYKPPPIKSFIAKQEPWHENADTVRKFFPDAGWQEYYLEDTPIAVQSVTALPSHTIHSYIETKRIYEMMMQQSDGIGVNCGYCHNSRVFQSWAQSTPYRWIGYYGIELTRDLNRNYLIHMPAYVPEDRELVNKTAMPVLPARDQGPQGGNGLVVCATCHYAQPKPLGGANMLQDYPGLTGTATTASAAAPAALATAALATPAADVTVAPAPESATIASAPQSATPASAATP